MPRRQRLCRGGHSGAALSRVAGQCDLGRLGQCDVPRRAARVVARGGSGLGGVAGPRREKPAGLPGAAEAVAFIGKAFRRPDSERVARLAVEKLALLAAAAALNQVSPHHAELFAAPGWPEITPACTAPSILATTTSGTCWSGRCRDVAVANLESQLMDSLEIPTSPVAPAPVDPQASRPPRVWKFWGTALWGLFIFAAMFIGQIAVVGLVPVRQEGPIDRRRRDPRRSAAV